MAVVDAMRSSRPGEVSSPAFIRSLKTKGAKLFGLAALALALMPNAYADQYPSKPIRLIVPYGTGGGTDIIARLYAQKLKESWGQSVVVENRPGGDGVIGSELIARS